MLYIYIYIYVDVYNMCYVHVIHINIYNTPSAQTYPHARIPAARLFLIFLRFAMFSSMWEVPKSGWG